MFITLEGIDASGKTTQVPLLENKLRERGYDILVTRQPGGTRIGSKIREILLNPENSELVPQAEVLLYIADRIQHIKEIIQPALEQGRIVICDRYHDATLAYQGAGRQMDLSWLKPLQEKHIAVPDLTVWFDISVEQSQQRLQQRNQELGTENCRLESEDFRFFERVREAYVQMFKSEPHRYARIDAGKAIPVVQQQVLQTVLDRIG